ncbi:VanZ family protein [Pseudarthrobacter sp. NPDC055928]|uniref:VanZ family protein n=1 Tax=Pseudarthrobacter sp. NPDC055928 TaxID=3345661 RepID=UPI0035DA487E
MLVPLGLVAFWPSPVDRPIQGELATLLRFLHAQGIPTWFNYKFVEASANLILFVPLGVVASLAFPDKRWWQIGAFGLIVSGLMELGQLLFLPDRSATLQDLVTNTVGALIGAWLAVAGRRRSQARRLLSGGPVEGSNNVR